MWYILKMRSSLKAFLISASIVSTSALAQDQISNLKEFECKSSETAIVSDVPDFDQFTLKGQVTSNMELRNVSLRFNNFPLREAFFGVLQPVSTSYRFFDGQDYNYELQFPRVNSETSFKSKITISLEGYISTEILSCNIQQ